MSILVTGGAGFVGHHLVHHLLATTSHKIVVMDRLDLSGSLHRLDEVCNEDARWRYRLKFVHHDLKAPINPHLARKLWDVTEIYHVAAASHVDRSIEDPMSFAMDNVIGTVNLLEWYRKECNHAKFLYFSTDEVFGPAPDDWRYGEWDRYRSGNPYAASKAGAEEFCIAYENTYKLNIVVTHTMNVIGERQNPEKFVPQTITKVLRGCKVLIHSNADKTRAGTRFYIHARDVAIAAAMVMQHGERGQKYNIVGEREVSNLEMAQMIANAAQRELIYEMVDFHSSRPGHDLRYALDGKLLENMGFRHLRKIDEHIGELVKWYIKNEEWLG